MDFNEALHAQAGSYYRTIAFAFRVTVNQNQVDGLLGQSRLIGFARQFRPVGNMGRAAAHVGVFRPLP